MDASTGGETCSWSWGRGKSCPCAKHVRNGAHDDVCFHSVRIMSTLCRRQSRAWIFRLSLGKATTSSFSNCVLIYKAKKPLAWVKFSSSNHSQTQHCCRKKEQIDSSLYEIRGRHFLCAYNWQDIRTVFCSFCNLATTGFCFYLEASCCWICLQKPICIGDNERNHCLFSNAVGHKFTCRF